MNYKESIDLLIKTFPDFSEDWKRHLEYWDGEERSVGLDITAFSNYISKKLEQKETYDFQLVFQFIEKLLVEGNDSVQTAVTTMFLENLVNFSSNGRFDSKDFVKFLGPKSIEYCKAWDKAAGIKGNNYES